MVRFYLGTYTSMIPRAGTVLRAHEYSLVGWMEVCPNCVVAMLARLSPEPIRNTMEVQALRQCLAVSQRNRAVSNWETVTPGEGWLPAVWVCWYGKLDGPILGKRRSRVWRTDSCCEARGMAPRMPLHHFGATHIPLTDCAVRIIR